MVAIVRTRYCEKKTQILRNDTYEDFIVRNRVNGTFTPSKLPPKVQLIDVEEVNQIFDSLGNQTQQWENLYSRFPDVEGISSVSRVGFSHDNWRYNDPICLNRTRSCDCIRSVFRWNGTNIA